MRKYWDVIEDFESIDYNVDGYKTKGTFSLTDERHPIFDENETVPSEAPRSKHYQHWDQLESFDTYLLKGQYETF